MRIKLKSFEGFILIDNSIAISQIECDRRGKTLPCITLCPLPGFRDLYNVTVDIESYLNDTYGKEDIFVPEMLKRLNDTKKWMSIEIFTTLMGRCSMTCLQREVKAIEFNKNITYYLKTQRNYQVNTSTSDNNITVFQTQIIMRLNTLKYAICRSSVNKDKK